MIEILKDLNQDGGVGNGSKDQYIFRRVATDGKAPPDVDAVNVALDGEIDALYSELGVPRVDRWRTISELRIQFDTGDRLGQVNTASRILNLRRNLLEAVNMLGRRPGQIFPPVDDVIPPIL